MISADNDPKASMAEDMQDEPPATAADRARGASPELARAADGGDLEAVRRLLADGEPPDAAAADRAGRRVTPLHRAALRGHVAVVDVLLAAGAHADARIGGGPPPWDRAALHLAAAAGHREIVEALLRAGADPAAQDLDAHGSRRTAMELAAERRHEAIAELLRRAGGEPPERPPDVAADRRESGGRYAARRGLHVDEGVRAPSLILVRAEVEDTARALQSREGARTWWRDVHGEDAELTRRCFAVLRLAGHRWSVVTSLLADGPHMEEHDAVRLGLALGVPSLRTAAGSGAVCYAYFDGDVCLERMTWRPGLDLGRPDLDSLDVDFESHIQALTAAEIEDPRTRADVFLAELDAWAPHQIGPLGSYGEELCLDLGLERPDVERLDYVAVW